MVSRAIVDNSGTYLDYVRGRPGVDASAIKIWDAMRLPPTHPEHAKVGGDGAQLSIVPLSRATARILSFAQTG